MTIEKTKNYGKFNLIRGNRMINRKYLSKLAKAVSDNNLLPQNPIIVNARMEVLDGQHRLKVAEILKTEIYYTVVPVGSIEEVRMLNTNVRQWTVPDYLNSFIDLGLNDYRELQEFASRYDLSISISMHLLSDSLHRHYKRTKLLDEFKNGDFKITSLEYAKEMVKKLKDLSRFCEPGVTTDRDFIYALEKTFLSGYSHAMLMDKLDKSGQRIPRYGHSKEYIRKIEDILSWKSPVIRRILKSADSVADFHTHI